MNEDELAEFLEQGPPPGRRARPARGARPDGVHRLLGDEATWAEPAPAGADALFAAIRTELPDRPPTAGAPPRRGAPRPVPTRGNGVPAPAERRRELTPARAWALLGPRSRLVAGGAAAGLLLLGLLGGLALGGDGGGPGNEWASRPEWLLTGASEAPGVGATGAVRAKDTPSGLEVWLAVDGLPPAPAGSYYEACLTGPNGEVSIGSFHVRDGDDPIILWSGVDFAAYPTFVVTLEAEGGDPAVDGPVVLSGQVGP